LLQAFLAIGGRRFVGVGSCAEYDWSDPDLESGMCHEMETPLKPRTVYGRTKKELFDWAESQCRHHRTEFGWARLFSIYGSCEDSRRVVPSVIKALLAGHRAAISPGSQICDFLHVDDVGRALAVLTGSTVAGAVNVGSGNPISVAGICQRIADLMGMSDALDFGALPARPDEPPRLVPDVNRLCHEIGFMPATGLDDGLQKAINWWRLASVKSS
jgi:nucleoside-diphosphate-sugar epimerase